MESLNGIEYLKNASWLNNPVKTLRTVRFLPALLVFGFLLFASPFVWGQAFVNGSIAGVITDNSGAVIPGVKMTLKNLGTNFKMNAVTNATGLYQFLNLPPGDYGIEADITGFQHFARKPITVEVNAGVHIDITLGVGAVSQQITVTAATPLLEPLSSSLGQVVASRPTKELPLNGRNPLALVALVPGAVPQNQSGGTPVGKNPFAPSNFQIGGGFSQQSSAYWDGSPLNSGYGHNMAIVPTQDAIREFKVQTNNLSASYGRFFGGIVNLTTDSGSNVFHGSAYEFIRNKALNANNFFNNSSHVPVPAFTQNQFGVTWGGPVILPKVYNGKDRTFFFFSYGGFRLRQGQAFLLSVPTPNERQGDFSALGTPIYDATTTHADPNSSGHYLRDQLSCNGVLNVICPGRIDPASAKLVSLWALPNIPGAKANLNNWAGNASSGGDQNQETLRIDHSISSKQRIFSRYTFDKFNSLKLDVFGTGAMTSATPGGGQPEILQNQQFVFDHSYSLSPNTIADVNVSYLRQFYNRTALSTGMDLGTLSSGWGSLNNQVSYRTWPAVSVAGITSFTPNTGSEIREWSNVYDISPNVATIKGRHTLKFGGELEVSRFNYIQLAGAGGVFGFDQSYTALDPTKSSGGFGFASFLMGYPSSGTLAVAVPVAAQQLYPALYVEDTFRATRKLTLTLGVRYERTGTWSERFNRLSAFDAYLASPAAQANGLAAKGAFELVSSSNRGIRNNINPPGRQFSPRIGLAYQLTPKTVIRTGYGIFWVPNDVAFNSSPNYDPIDSFTNSFVASINGGLNPYGTFSNPFPSGLIAPPQRNSSFQSMLLGQSISNVVLAPNAPFGYAQQFNFDVQRELPKDTLVDIAYAGAKGTHLTLGGYALDQLAPQYMSMGSALLASVPNPFAGLITSGTLSKATTTQAQLLRPYPQYTGLSWVQANLGDSHYESLQVKVRKNFSAGQSLLLAYTFSKNISNADALMNSMETGGVGGIQNYYNMRGEQSLSSFDMPRRMVVSYVLDLPVGKGRKYLTAISGPAGKLVSGWGINGIATYESGFPLQMVTSSNLTNSSGGGSRPNFNTTTCPSGAPLQGSAESRLTKWFNTACFSQPAAYTFGNVSRTMPNVRSDGMANWDFALFKNTTFGPDNKLAVQFRGEFFNLFNKPQFDFPGQTFGTGQFGIVSAQLNNPRLVQFGLKFTF